MDEIMMAEGVLENGVHWTLFRPAGQDEGEYKCKLAAAIETATCDAVRRRVERESNERVCVRARRVSDG